MRYSFVFFGGYFGGCFHGHRSTVPFNPLKITKTSCPPKPPACEVSHWAYINPCVNCCGVSWIPLYWYESRITQALTFISADMIFEQYNNNALSTDMEWYYVFVRDRLTRMWHPAVSVAVSWQDSFSSESVPLKWKEVSHNLRPCQYKREYLARRILIETCGATHIRPEHFPPTKRRYFSSASVSICVRSPTNTIWVLGHVPGDAADIFWAFSSAKILMVRSNHVERLYLGVEHTWTQPPNCNYE